MIVRRSNRAVNRERSILALEEVPRSTGKIEVELRGGPVVTVKIQSIEIDRLGVTQSGAGTQTAAQGARSPNMFEEWNRGDVSHRSIRGAGGFEQRSSLRPGLPGNNISEVQVRFNRIATCEQVARQPADVTNLKDHSLRQGALEGNIPTVIDRRCLTAIQ